jgi:hypothetical protein
LQRLKDQVETLAEREADLKAERMMQSDLEAIKKIDPKIESIEDLGETFVKIINQLDEDGERILTPEEAYYAARAHDGLLEKTKPKAPEAPGAVNTGAPDKTYFTRDEVERMTPEEVEKHYDAIEESQRKWGL